MKNLGKNRNIVNRTLSLQRGASLLEGIAYLGIAAIVILGAVSLLTGAFGSAQVNRATEQVTALRTNIKKLYAGQIYPADIVPTLITAGGVPSTLAISSGALSNGWGGAVTVVGSNGAAGANNFVITYNSVPQDACISMLSGATGWTQVAVGSTTITAFPVTTAAATGACAAGANVVALTAT